MSEDKHKRKAISKRVRFDVFKCDSFKCQYCGQGAPDVLLQIDHVIPVSKGGTNGILNLVTACTSCNSGKSDRLLDENSTLAKTRLQAEYLQERREQIDMMAEWMQGLRSLDDSIVDHLSEYWNSLVPSVSLSETGRNNLRKTNKSFSYEEIVNAMNIAAERYVKYDSDGDADFDSCELAFSKVSGICNVARQKANDPDLDKIYYVRAIVRNRLTGRYYDNTKALWMLKSARKAGVTLDTLQDIAKRTNSWSQFDGEVDDAVVALEDE